METLIDIYLPTYKPNEEYLTAAIDSVIAQTEERWQLWINDQHQDFVDTQTVVWRYRSDERIHFNSNRDTAGIGANWNDCLQYGTAPYVQYMFQDDLWDPHYLQRGREILDEYPDVGFVSLGHDYQFEDDAIDRQPYDDLKSFISFHLSEGRQRGREFLFRWMEHGLHPNAVGEPPFVMLRRAAMQSVGRFREDMLQNLDSEYWVRMLLVTNWYYLSGHFGKFRVHGEAASAQNAVAGKGLLDRVRMFRTVISQLEGAEKKRAQRVFRRHQVKMLEKFINRYSGGRRVHFSDRDTAETILAKHPLLILKSMWRYWKKHSQPKLTK